MTGAFLALLAIPSLSWAQMRACPTAGRRAQRLRSFAVDYITNPSHSAVRARYGIVAGDTSSLVIVTVRIVRPVTTGEKIHFFFDAAGKYLGKW